MATRGLKIGNEYAAAMGKFYGDTPKAVFAAIAYSLSVMLGESTDPDEVIARMTREWEALYANGIVNQSPPKK